MRVSRFSLSKRLLFLPGFLCIFALSYGTAYAQRIDSDPVYQIAELRNLDLTQARSCGNLPPVFSGYCGDVIRQDRSNASTYTAFSVSPGDEVRCSTNYIDPTRTNPVNPGGVISGSNSWIGTNLYAKCIVRQASGGWITYDQGLGWASEVRYYDEAGNEDRSRRDIIGPTEAAIDNATTAGGFVDTLQEIARDILRGVTWLILQLATWLLAIAGTLFNWVMVKAVFQFSTLIGASPGLLTAWSILRDVGNMFLLFGFIFIGIAMILDLHSYPAKKALPRLIIFAILMNFSLFVAGAVIDTSNGLSAILYNQANTQPCQEGDAIGMGAANPSQEECTVNYGLAGYIMQATGLSSTYSADGDNRGLPGLTAMIGLAMFALIGAFVFFAAAIMLIIRAVVLAFLMVLAPIGFAALAVPPLEKHGKEWWNRLIHQSFFAPIFILLVFVSLKITDSFAASTTRGSLAAAVTHPEASVMGVIMVFALVIGFFIFSLVAAKRFGAMGADFAIKTASGITAGTVGFAGRRTFGAGFNFTQKAIGKTKWGRSTWLGNLAYDAAGVGAKSSFDLRKASPIKKGSDALGLKLGEPGKAASGGFAGEVKAKAEKNVERAKGFELNKKEKQAIADAEKAAEAEKREQRRREREFQNQVIAERTSAEADLKPRRAELARKEAEIQEAREAGNEALAQSLEATYANDLAQYGVVERASQERIKDLQDAASRIRNQSKENVERLEQRVKNIKNQPKLQYASGLESRGIPVITAMSNAANAKAAKEIRDNLNKSKTELALDRLEASVKKAGDSAHDDMKAVKDTVHEEAEAHENKDDNH